MNAYRTMLYKTEVVMFCVCTYIATLFTPRYVVPVFLLGFMADKMSAVLYIKLQQTLASYIFMVFGDISSLKHEYANEVSDEDEKASRDSGSDGPATDSGNMLFHTFAYFARHGLEEKLLALWEAANNPQAQENPVDANIVDQENKEPDWPPSSGSSETGSSEPDSSESEDGEETKEEEETKKVD